MYGEDVPYEVVDACTEEQREVLWNAASGLQEVDGLRVSEYAESVGRGYVSGEYSAYDARRQIEEYHANEQSRQAEADVVTGRILTMLSTAGHARFTLDPSMLKSIHRALFDGQLPDRSWVGSWRYEMISKPEPVLGGRSVQYESPDYRRGARA